MKTAIIITTAPVGHQTFLGEGWVPIGLHVCILRIIVFVNFRKQDTTINLRNACGVDFEILLYKSVNW